MSVGKHAVGRRPLGRLALLLALAMVVSAFAVGPLASAEKMLKSDVCHWDGDAGIYFMINVNQNAYPAHKAHGDLYADEAVGEEAPNLPGYEFGGDCAVDFVPIPVATVTVPATDPAGANSPALAAGPSYKFEVTGTWTNRSGADFIDAECVNESTGGGWLPGPLGYPVDLLNLQVNTATVDWVPVGTATGAGCADGQEYTYDFTGSGVVNFRIYDGTGNNQNPDWFGDNAGSLTVKISQMTP